MADDSRELRAGQAEAEGSSAGAAKWAAMKDLERAYPGISVEQVEFEVVEERGDDEDGGPLTRVLATADLQRWQAAADEFEWPDDPTERVRTILRRVVSALGLRASVDMSERDDEIWAEISGPELGLLIGKHGQTLDALQSICMQAAFRGSEDRRPVVVDAAGYRERRDGVLKRQADRGVADALRYGRAIELDTMGSQERKVVHNYLKDRVEVDTHSEGEEPFRRIVITPLRPGPSG